jgi:hypothetical protein
MAIMNRLQLKNMDRHPSMPYEINEVYKSAHFILQSSINMGSLTLPKAEVIPTQVTTESGIKLEDLNLLFENFGKTLIEALSVVGANKPNPVNRTSDSKECNMCGGPHFIRECAVVDEYIKVGKARRNHEGKVVLSTGAFVPRDIPGRLLKERIDEWHRRHLNQMENVASTLVHTISKGLLNSHIASSAAPEINPAYQLTTTDRIATLEAELFNLRARKPPVASGPRTRAQRAREPTVDIEEEEEEEAATVRTQQKSRIEEVVEDTPARCHAPILIGCEIKAYLIHQVLCIDNFPL